MPASIHTPLEHLDGIGPKRAEILRKAGVHSLIDLLLHKPFRYEDRTNFRAIADLRAGEEAVVQGEILASGAFRTPRKGMRIFEMRVGDASGALAVKFFNQPYLEKTLRKGRRVILFGAPQLDGYSLGLSMINPEYELADSDDDKAIHAGRVVPIYRKLGQFQSKGLRALMARLLEAIDEKDLPEILPLRVLKAHRFPSRVEAFRQIHFPVSPESRGQGDLMADLAAFATPAQRRMVFEELYLFQLGLWTVKMRRQRLSKGRSIQVTQETRQIIKKMLPFHPTAAQKRVLKEIVVDLASARVMSRLLQGDVGSGKTIVALQAMIVVLECGYQCVLMAPTELLAEQHFRTLGRYLQGFPYRLVFLSGNVKGKERKEALKSIASGEADLIVGTHAVFQKEVDFKRLGFVVIDEQHRFGVSQRSQLMEKGEHPDTLVMTATPIPRSLALTLYGDLELSALDELPPGRKPVQTLLKTEKHRRQVYEGLRRQLKEGRQVYIVYPLVEESEKLDLRAAVEMAEHLGRDVFPEFEVGVMHGRLKADEREELMRRFQDGKTQILVSTTVIEVGIDVANASLMVVEHADRFGLSQLHQLRGRVGRGAHESFCILMFDELRSADARSRLQIMRQTNDGFKIAEKDLEIRGPGEFGGTRQWGVPDFVFANIVRDRKALELAKREADRQIEKARKHNRTPEDLQKFLGRQWKKGLRFFDVG